LRERGGQREKLKTQRERDRERVFGLVFRIAVWKEGLRFETPRGLSCGMERLVAAGETTSPSEYVSWEEVLVSSDKGRREVHYFLKRRDGASDLAVIGKEKSLRHMSYHYAIRDRALLPSSSSLSKLKSRREVVDWLSFIVSGAYPYPSLSPFAFQKLS